MEASLAYSSVDLLRARRRLHIVGRYTSPVWDRQNHSQLGLSPIRLKSSLPFRGQFYDLSAIT